MLTHILTCVSQTVPLLVKLERIALRHVRHHARLDSHIGRVGYVWLFVHLFHPCLGICLHEYACIVATIQLPYYMVISRPIAHVCKLVQHPRRQHTGRIVHHYALISVQGAPSSGMPVISIVDVLLHAPMCP